MMNEIRKGCVLGALDHQLNAVAAIEMVVDPVRQETDAIKTRQDIDRKEDEARDRAYSGVLEIDNGLSKIEEAVSQIIQRLNPFYRDAAYQLINDAVIYTRKAHATTKQEIVLLDEIDSVEDYVDVMHAERMPVISKGIEKGSLEMREANTLLDEAALARKKPVIKLATSVG